MRQCIHGCGNEIKKGSSLNECTTCRHALYYWRNKRPAQIIERRRKLNVYGSRLDEHFNTRGSELETKPASNVVAFRPKKRA